MLNPGLKDTFTSLPLPSGASTEAKQDTGNTSLGIISAKANNYAIKVTVSGTTTYVAKAAMGSAQASAVWQSKKIAVSGADTVITWADGNANFDNVATDLTVLTYS